MELYLDTADVRIIEKFHRTLPLAGVTTNLRICFILCELALIFSFNL